MSTINTIPELGTKGVLLRGFEYHDAVILLERAGSETPAAATTAPHESIAHNALRFMTYLANSISFRQHGIYLIWIVMDRGLAEIAGTISFSQSSELEGSVDHAIIDVMNNADIAVTAVTTVIAWAFRTLPELTTIRAECSADDPLLAWLHARCRMHFVCNTLHITPDLKGAPRRISEWAITRSDFVEANNTAHRTPVRTPRTVNQHAPTGTHHRTHNNDVQDE